MLSSAEVHYRLAVYYLDLVEYEVDTIDIERDALPHCLIAFHRLSIEQPTNNEIHLVLSRLLKTLFPTLLAGRWIKHLLNWCAVCLQTCLRWQDDPSWIYLLRSEVYSTLGQWDMAEADLETVAALNHESSTEIHAHTLYGRGRLQLNRGNYQEALPNLRQAQELLAQLGDKQRSIQAAAELAAYEMNAGHLRRALVAYRAIAAMRYELNPVHPPDHDHTLLMLGVIHRKLHQYGLAEQYLTELRAFTQSSDLKNAMATASHHLAWVYIDQKRLEEAASLCHSALADYAEMSDPRGMGDAYEQLGVIQFQQDSIAFAIDSLEKSLILRQTVGNRQGMASSLRRLTYVHLALGHFGRGVGYLRQCVELYRQIGVMNVARVSKLAYEFTDALRIFTWRTASQWLP